MVRYPPQGSPLGIITGLDANKPSNPVPGMTYYATDTLKTYNCYAIGYWTLINSLASEKYSNHLGAVDNFTQAVANGLNWTFTPDAVNHKMTLNSGATNAGSVYFNTKKAYTIGGDSAPLILNFIMSDIVANGFAVSSCQFFGMSSNFLNPVTANSIFFGGINGSVAWRAETITGGVRTSTVLWKLATDFNNVLCTIALISSRIVFMFNGVVVAIHNVPTPTVPMYVGAGIVAAGAPFIAASNMSVDYFEVLQYI